ncbi:glycosyltransferase family 1 protein [Paenimyroides tangerinum]|uniref:Glycosyltransferase family 1 protein n=1 Tax=Paenimyroides tangerinum TaxID=2488728 RepID=A0A3P3WAA0_9FLAO|nr:glycosyltransferase family 4 protein [Paenimyroides tangerinum]RRJ89563.1 glycosyltransferase family 1 protein [Paenimyroides tangerinum]
MKNNKTKVLLFSPLRGKIGGITRWTDNIMTYYNKISPLDIELFQYYPFVKDKQGFFLFNRLYRGFFYYVPSIFVLFKLLKKEQIQVLHFCSSGSFGLFRDYIFLKMAKFLKVKSVIHFHFGRIPDLQCKNNWEYKLICIIIKNVDLVVVIDDLTLTTLKDFGFKNIVLIPNPVSPRIKEIIESNPNIKRNDNIILFAGHHLPSKGIFELISACKELKNIKLRMIGYFSDEILQEIFDKAGNENESWLEIVGEVNFDEIIKEMLACGIFILPSHTEAFPNVIIESMATKCPIISTNVGAIPQMLNVNDVSNLCGLVVQPKNEIELKEAIIKLLDNKDLSDNISSNAETRVNSLYSIQVVWNKLEQIWNVKSDDFIK